MRINFNNIKTGSIIYTPTNPWNKYLIILENNVLKFFSLHRKKTNSGKVYGDLKIIRWIENNRKDEYWKVIYND